MRTETVIKEKLVPVPVPADSAIVRMLVECDSTNNVVVKELMTLKSQNVQAAINHDSNSVEISFKKPLDTVYIHVNDTVRIQEKSVIVEVEKPPGFTALVKDVIIGFIYAILTFCIVWMIGFIIYKTMR